MLKIKSIRASLLGTLILLNLCDSQLALSALFTATTGLQIESSVHQLAHRFHVDLVELGFDQLVVLLTRHRQDLPVFLLHQTLDIVEHPPLLFVCIRNVLLRASIIQANRQIVRLARELEHDLLPI